MIFVIKKSADGAKKAFGHFVIKYQHQKQANF
jgi:hypothetical protein